MKDPFYDYDGDEEEAECNYDQEPEDDWQDATDAEYDRIADSYERKIYGD